MSEGRIIYRNAKKLKAGQIERFKIDYYPEGIQGGTMMPAPSLWVKVKNKEPLALRAAYLAGPYVLYVDCVSEDYSIDKKCFITAEQPRYEPQLLPGQSFYAELSCHTFKSKYSWTVDIISQIVFNNTTSVDFEIMVGTSKKILHEATFSDKPLENRTGIGIFNNSDRFEVTNHDTLDLWNLPIPDERPIHLVILTHGLHSNSSADMLYLKERINKIKNENIVVKGFFGNVGKTERGIKYLGSRLGDFIVNLVMNNESLSGGKIKKISFIGHSLGGLVQTFAIAYIQVNCPSFFEEIEPCNFITIASPMLGVAYENPAYVKLALSAGVVGKSGRDLTLKCDENNKPLLILLPTGPTHKVLKKFRRRTLYANILNDAIVPLRTSALYFLDYKSIKEFLKDEQKSTSSIADPETYESLTNQLSELDSSKSSKSTIPSQFQSMLSFFMPQKQSKYDRYSKLSADDGTSLKNSGRENVPKASLIESAASLILPPLPPLKYITDPEFREDVIVHDKLYTSAEISDYSALYESFCGSSESPVSRINNRTTADSAKPDEKLRSMRRRLMDTFQGGTQIKQLEKQIAEEYHKNMTWRKVLVNLKPDAHNNIIVRRRFANAYGWPVIENLVETHFNIDEDKFMSSSKPLNEDISTDDIDNQIELSSMLSRDIIEQENKDIDLKSEHTIEDNSWITAENNAESLFATGPTGFVSDMVETLHDQWNNYNGVSDNGLVSEQYMESNIRLNE